MENTTGQKIEVGFKVIITVPEGHSLRRTAWWPKSGIATGTVERLFKNGKVAVAVDQVGNFSADRKWTGHFEVDLLTVR